MNEGSCLCGALEYEVEGPFVFAGHCHCSMCRKHHGSAFATFLGFASSGLRWRQGEEKVVVFESSANGRRGFCGTCGSVAPMSFGELAMAPAGNLSGELSLEGQCHMFVASKAPWHEIADALPQFDESPPGYPPPAIDRPTVEATPGVVLGSCLCGDVRFELSGEADGLRHCHCRRCRLARSAAHATNLFATKEKFRFLSGEDSCATYKLPEAERFGNDFCKRCGSLVPRMAVGRPYVVIPAGALDTDPGLRPTAHIFVGSKAPWYEISGALPQYAEYPPA